MDNSNWGVTPFCLAWGNNTIHGDAEHEFMLSYGDYKSGTGLGGNPMKFEGGSDASCKRVGLMKIITILSEQPLNISEEKQSIVLRVLL